MWFQSYSTLNDFERVKKSVFEGKYTLEIFLKNMKL